MDIKFDQPTGYSGLMQKSKALYSNTLRGTFLLSLLLSIIVFIPRMVSLYFGIDVFYESAGYSAVSLWLVFIDLATMIVMIAIFYHLNCELGHKRDNIKQDIREGFFRVLYVFAAAIIQTLIIFVLGLVVFKTQMLLYTYDMLNNNSWWGHIGFACFFAAQTILLLYIFTLFIFYLPIISVENRAVFRSLLQSAKLVWNHWWLVFSVQITPWFAYFFALIFLRMMGLDVHIYFAENSQSTMLATAINIIAFAIYIPWVASLLLVQLKDLELRYQQQHA